jgi:hypothetical protein
MSIMPGALKLKDPASVKNGQFDWGTNYLDTGVEIAGTPTVTVSGPDALLVSASVALASGNRKVNYRLSAGTLGATYTVTCQIVTNESPAQTDERSIQVLVQHL